MKFANLVSFVTVGLVLSLSVKENVLVDGHGYLIEPPSRASAWTVDADFQKCCVEYNHNQMFCGGFSTQWEKNGGRCGICGDDFAQPEPRTFEKGGAKYLGKVVRTYLPNSSINISVIITANHMGFFEFRLCNVDGFEGDATEECLNKTILTIGNTNNHKFMIQNTTMVANYTLKLPNGFTCNHCVLQWKYVTGNGWGVDPDTKVGCVGCGPVQENFMGCADIAIGHNPILPTYTTSKITTPSTAQATQTSSASTTTSTSTTTKAPTTTAAAATQSSSSSTTTSTTTTTSSTTASSTPSTTPSSSSSTTTQSTVVPVTEDEEEDYGLCSSNLEFGNILDISRLVSIYCYRMCKVNCPLILTDVNSSFENRSACSRTCPILCKC